MKIKNKNGKSVNKVKKSTKKNINNKKLKTRKSKTKVNKKNKHVIIIIVLFICFLIPISYSIFTYIKNGINNNNLISGKIYMNYTSSRQLLLNNVLPRNELDSNAYIEFQIKGLNEYSRKDIWYAISLEYGDVPSGKNSNNRIRDNLLRFTLTKKINNGLEKTVLEDVAFNDIDNLRLYVDKIQKNTSNEIVYTYKLYVWISNDLVIGNVNQDYTESEWNNIFASIKINVEGDFNPKEAVNSIKVSFDANGGTVPEAYRYYLEGDTYGELPIATKEGCVFEGWRASNNVKVHTNKELQSNENHTLTAVWAIVKYSHPGEYTFNGSNYIDTGVDLFSEEFAHRNFYISFDITKIDANNNSNGTIIDSQMASNPKYGFIFQRNSSSQFRMSDNGNKSTYLRSNIYYGTQNIKIIRINDIIYYSLNDGGFTKAGDYTDFTSYFSKNVIFGAKLGSGNNYQNFFTGKLSNMIIKLIVSNDISIDDYLYSTDKFEYDGDIEFNGSTAINTGVYLFSEENASRNFYMSFDIKNIDWGNTNQSTIMSSKDESGSPWPGFELRRYGSSTTYMQSKATKAAGNANDANRIPITTKNIRFMRLNNVLYYSLDGGNFIQHYNFTGFNLYFNVPVVFGNAYNVETQRYFKGTISNILVQFIKDEDYQTYQDMLTT